MKLCGAYTLAQAANLLGVRAQSFYHYKRTNQFKTAPCSPYALSEKEIATHVDMTNRKIKSGRGKPPKQLKMPAKVMEFIGCKHLIDEKEAMKRTGLCHGSLLMRLQSNQIEGKYMPCQKMMFDPESIEKFMTRNKNRGKIHLHIYPRVKMLRKRFGDKGDFFSYKETVKNCVDDLLKKGVLDERDVIILRARMGIDVQVALSLDEVGKRFGITRQRVKQLESRALYKIAQNKV